MQDSYRRGSWLDRIKSGVQNARQLLVSHDKSSRHFHRTGKEFSRSFIHLLLSTLSFAVTYVDICEAVLPGLEFDKVEIAIEQEVPPIVED